MSLCYASGKWFLKPEPEAPKRSAIRKIRGKPYLPDMIPIGAAVLSLKDEDVLTYRRYATGVRARQIICLVMSDDFGASYARIAEVFRRERTTIMHSVLSARERLWTDQTFKEDYWRVRAAIMALVID